MFKSMTIFQLTQSPSAVLERLLDALDESRHQFKECTKHQAMSRGFVKPLGEDSDVMHYETNNAVLFCLRTDEKVVPAAMVKLKVNRLVREKEDAGEELSKTDIRLLKEEVIESMLPGAIPAPSRTYAVFDKSTSMLYVGGNEEGADNFIDFLKVALEGMPFALLALNDVDPCAVYTRILSDPGEHLPEVFELGDACTLKHPKEGGTAVLNISHEDLEAEDLGELLKAGKECCGIALQHEHVSFAITANLGLRRLSLSEDSKAAIAEDESDAPGVNLTNEYALWVITIRDVLRELEALFGGWPQQDLLDLGEAA